MKSNFRHTLLTLALVLAASFASQAHALYTPQEALRDVMSDNLQLVGKWIPSYSESGKIPVCVYRGNKVVVYQSYCTKKFISAFGTRIHSVNPKKGYVTIYAETTQEDDITKATRDRYSVVGWSVSSKTSKKFKFRGSARDFRRFDETLSKDPGPGCITTRTLPLYCKPEFARDAKSWGEPAKAFWDKPTTSWYQVINKITNSVPEQAVP